MDERDERRDALGQWGEALAARYLEERGWSIAARNWRSGRGEVDLIARRSEPGYGPGETRHVVAFVEVKTRRQRSSKNRPACSVTRRKRRQLVGLAARWRQRHGRHAPLSIRFDVIGVTWREEEEEALIRHYKGAFDARGEL